MPSYPKRVTKSKLDNAAQILGELLVCEDLDRYLNRAQRVELQRSTTALYGAADEYGVA